MRIFIPAFQKNLTNPILFLLCLLILPRISDVARKELLLHHPSTKSLGPCRRLLGGDQDIRQPGDDLRLLLDLPILHFKLALQCVDVACKTAIISSACPSTTPQQLTSPPCKLVDNSSRLIFLKTACFNPYFVRHLPVSTLSTGPILGSTWGRFNESEA